MRYFIPALPRKDKQSHHGAIQRPKPFGCLPYPAQLIVGQYSVA
jgi:hypothetical protein